jgi:phosphoserine phosphatase
LSDLGSGRGGLKKRFASVVLDVDSTLTRLEGIEWLAARRGPVIAHTVATMTDRAMHGTAPLEAVYADRLALVRPTRTEVAGLARAYVDGVVTGALDAVAALRKAQIRLAILSGGVREAVAPFAASLGIADHEVHAVSLRFTPDGAYAGFDTASPLTRNGGKPAVVRALGLPRPVLAVGDGSTDAELKTDAGAGARGRGGPAVDAFAAFVGVARRESVVAVADFVMQTLAELPVLVLGEGADLG